VGVAAISAGVAAAALVKPEECQEHGEQNGAGECANGRYGWRLTFVNCRARLVCSCCCCCCCQ
jgi:hypothetical protein